MQQRSCRSTESIGPKVFKLSLDRIDALRKDFVFDYFAALNYRLTAKSFDDALAMMGNLMVGLLASNVLTAASTTSCATSTKWMRRICRHCVGSGTLLRQPQRQRRTTTRPNSAQILSDALGGLNKVVEFGEDDLPLMNQYGATTNKGREIHRIVYAIRS